MRRSTNRARRSIKPTRQRGTLSGAPLRRTAEAIASSWGLAAIDRVAARDLPHEKRLIEVGGSPALACARSFAARRSAHLWKWAARCAPPPTPLFRSYDCHHEDCSLCDSCSGSPSDTMRGELTVGKSG